MRAAARHFDVDTTDVHQSKIGKGGPFKTERQKATVDVQILKTLQQAHQQQPEKGVWEVRAVGFGKDNRGKPTCNGHIRCYLDKEAQQAKFIWENKIEEHWRVHNFREIKEMAEVEFYLVCLWEALQLPNRAHQVQASKVHPLHSRLLQHTPPLRRVEEDLAMQGVWSWLPVLPDSIRQWGYAWCVTKVERAIERLEKRKGKHCKHFDKEQLAADNIPSLPSSSFRMSPARYSREHHLALPPLCSKLVQLISSPWPQLSSQAVMAKLPVPSTTGTDPCELSICTTGLLLDQPNHWYPYSLFLNLKERLAALAPSIDLCFQHGRVHSRQSCWIVPFWYNIPKKNGIGLTVELTVLAAHLCHSKAEGKEEVIRAALLEISKVKSKVLVLEEASMAWSSPTGGQQSLKGKIEAAEELFHGSQLLENKAGRLISSLEHTKYNFTRGRPYDYHSDKMDRVWRQTMGHVKAFILDFVQPFEAANPNMRLKKNGQGFPTFFLPSAMLTQDVCNFLAHRADQAQVHCNFGGDCSKRSLGQAPEC